MRNANSITHGSANGILVVLVAGRADVDSLVNYAHQYQDEWVQHACILWDLRALDPMALTSAAIHDLPESFAAIIDLRTGGRTALLVTKDLELIANFIVVQAEMKNGQRVEHRAFCSEEDATSWLQAI